MFKLSIKPETRENYNLVHHEGGCILECSAI